MPAVEVQTRKSRAHDRLICAVDGQALAARYASADAETLHGLLAPSPDEALERLAERWGGRPGPGGEGIDGLEVLRQFLAAEICDPQLLNGIVITAPHT